MIRGLPGARGYHPLLAVAGAAHFLRETVGRVRYGGARGQLTVRAGSGFYAHAVVAVCRRIDVRFSITIRQHNLIEAIPEDAWTPIPYWMDGAAAVAETTYTPFQNEPDAAPVRLIVRRVKPTPGSQLALFASYSYHGFITGRDGEMLELEADHRRHAEIENAVRDLKYGVGLNHLPSGRFAANAAWLAVQVLAHNPGPLVSPHRPGRADRDHQDPPAAVLLPGRTAHPLGAPPHSASSPALALGNPVQPRPGPFAIPATPVLTSSPAIGVPTSPLPSSQPKIPQHLAPDRPASFSCCVLSLSEWLGTTTAGHLPTPKIQNLPGQSLLQVPYPLLRHLYHPVRWIPV